MSEKSETYARVISALDAPITTLTGPTPASELWARCHSSPYVASMDDQPYRFDGAFGYSRTAMFEDLDWDALPREHQMLTGFHIAWLIEAEQRQGMLAISGEEVGIVVLAGLIHDMGETTHPDVLAAVGAVVGDIPAGQKTDDNRRVEAAVRHFLYSQLLSDVEPAVLERVEAIIAHQDTSVLHQIFEAAHTIQTFDTAMRAGQSLFKRSLLVATGAASLDQDEQRMTQLRRLYMTVGSYNLPIMRGLADTYAYAGSKLTEWQDMVVALERGERMLQLLDVMIRETAAHMSPVSPGATSSLG